MLNNLNQFKWQITPNPNEKQRERERSIKYAAKKGNERGNLEGLINLREEIGRVMGQKGEECWECCLRLLRRYSSHQSHCCFHFSLSLSLSLSLLLFSVFVCVCVSVTLFLCMNVFLPSFLPLSKLKWRFTLFVWSEFPSREPTVQLPPPPLPVSKLSPSPFLFYYFLFLI